MKKKSLIVSIISILSLFSARAISADGQVNFIGEITDQACDVVNNMSNPLNVTLGKVSRNAFTTLGATAAATRFTLQLTDCPETVSSASFTFDGVSANQDNNVLALTQSADVAKGVGVQLYDDTDSILPLHTISKSYPLASGEEVNNLDFIARYISTAATVEPGKANATATFTVIYN